MIFFNSYILHHSVLTANDKECYAIVPIQLSETFCEHTEPLTDILIMLQDYLTVPEEA